MSRKKTFLDIIGDRLAKLPDAAQIALILDPKCLFEETTTFLDANNREWAVFIYERNDLYLRNYLASNKEKEERLLIVARGEKRANSEEVVVDLSFIPDLVEEATDIIDCSPAGLLSSLVKDPLPFDLFEESLLSLWSHDLDRLIVNLSKYKKIVGKDKVLNRFDAMAIALTTSVPEINLEDLADLPYQPLPRLIFYLRTIVENDLDDFQVHVLQKLILESVPNKNLQAWCNFGRASLIRFLYLGLAVIRYALPKGVEELQRLGLLESDASELGDQVSEILYSLRRDLQFQMAITIEFEKSSPVTEDINKLVATFTFASFADALNALAEEPCPAIACCLAQRIINWMLPLKEGLGALSLWSQRESASKQLFPETPFAHKAKRYRELIEDTAKIEHILANAPLPPPSDLLSVMNTYWASEIHLLELLEAKVRDAKRLLNDKTVKDTVTQYQEKLRARIDAVIDAYDKTLASLITSDFSAYTRFPRLNTQILRDLIQAGRRHREKVWIIILDGLRLDSWDWYIWPRLREFFDIEGERQLYLATLPSYTDISRVSFLAGKLPPYWKDYNNHHTTDHNILLSRHLDLGRDESKKKLKIVARVEEKMEQGELDFNEAQYRCLIFNISDDWIHQERGSLVRVNEIVRERFEQMALPELSYKVEAGDIVVVTSDHGFIELREKFVRPFADNKFAKEVDVESIHFRYIQDGDCEGGVTISYEDKYRWTLAAGKEWFERPKGTGKRARYAHGGISLAEMVIPAVRLKKKTEKKVEVTIIIEPPKECSEGDVVTLPIKVINQGSVDTSVKLTCRLAGRLVAEDSLKLPGGASYPWSVSLTANPKANLVTITAEYVTPEKARKTEKRQVPILIKEVGAKVEIDTSALDVFDDK